MVEDTDSKHGGKNGKKEGVSGSSFFTWFMVIALLGVWTSVAVVWFDLVDYEEVLAKAKDFRYNLSEVLQGKLGVYDADGDGDFDVDDAKILLGRYTESFYKRESTTTGEEPVEPSKAKPKGQVKEKIKEQPTKVKEKCLTHIKELKTQDKKEPKALEKAKDIKHVEVGKSKKDTEKDKEKKEHKKKPVEEPKERPRRTTSRKTSDQDQGKKPDKKAAKESKSEGKK